MDLYEPVVEVLDSAIKHSDMDMLAAIRRNKRTL